MKNIIVNTTVALSVFALASCAVEQSVDTSTQLSKAEAHSADAHSNYLKPGASIDYSHDLKGPVDVGAPVDFELTLSEAYSAGSLSLNVTGEGAVIGSASGPYSFNMADADDHVVSLRLMGMPAGRHYVNVQALASLSDGSQESRVFSIPVQVGPEVAKKPAENMLATPDGETLIIMEAEEEIITSDE